MVLADAMSEATTSLHSTATLVSLLAGASMLVTMMVYSSRISRWLHRKRYQYEVTFSLYMLTPTEKFIFSTFFQQSHLTLQKPTTLLPPSLTRLYNNRDN